MHLVKQKNKYGLLFAFATLTPSVYAIEIDFQPGLHISGQYTDNLYLTPIKNREVIGELSPKFHISGTGNRSKFNADYLYRYRNSYGEKQETQNHIAKGNARLGLIKDYLTVSLNGQTGIRSKSYTNTKLIDQADLTTDTVQFSSLQSDIKFDNYYKKRFDMNASYAYNESYTNDRLFTNRMAHVVNAQIKNGRMYEKVEWSFTNQFRDENVSTLESRTLYYSKARLGYNFIKELNLSAITGYEKVNKAASNSSSLVKGKLFVTSFWWKPNKYFIMRTEYGYRAFGKSYLVDFKWIDDKNVIFASHSREAIGDISSVSFTKKNRLIDVNIGFRETLTTHELEYLNLITAQETAPDISSIPLFETIKTDETFKKHRYNASTIVKGHRNKIKFEIYVENRDYLARVPQGKEYGASSIWTLKLDAQYTFTAKAEFIRIRDQYLKSQDSFRKLDARLTHNITDKFTTSLRFSHWERRPLNDELIVSNNLNIDLDIGF